MDAAIRNDRVPVSYVSKFREYGIDFLDEGVSFVQILFCPWCGQRLPASLRDEWFAQLERRGIDPMDDEIPPEFMDESWFDRS